MYVRCVNSSSLVSSLPLYRQSFIGLRFNSQNVHRRLPHYLESRKWRDHYDSDVTWRILVSLALVKETFCNVIISVTYRHVEKKLFLRPRRNVEREESKPGRPWQSQPIPSIKNDMFTPSMKETGVDHKDKDIKKDLRYEPWYQVTRATQPWTHGPRVFLKKKFLISFSLSFSFSLYPQFGFFWI